MKSIAKFYTLFWIVYFPACIAYNDLPGFSSVDEAMTLLLIGYTWMKKGRKGTNLKPWKEFQTFLWILAFYVGYSLLLAVNVSRSVFLDLVQQIRPYSVLYCTWVLSPQFTRKQKKWMLYAMILTLFSWATFHLVGLDQEALNANSDVASEVAFPVLGQLAICSGMAYYLFTDATKRNKYIALGIVLTGLVAPKMKFVGEVVCFISILFFLQKKVKLNFSNFILLGTPVLLAILFLAWEKVDTYFISGASNENLARPMLYKNSLRVLWEYFPFGSGMGTYGTYASAKYFSPLYYKYEMDEIWGFGPRYGGAFVCDAYFSSLAQFGIVGIGFFITFWKRRLKAISKIKDIRYYRIAIMAALCLAIENTADSSYLSGKGMGYFMLLGLCLASLKPQTKRVVKVKRTSTLQGNVSSGTDQQTEPISAKGLNGNVNGNGKIKR